MVSRDVSPVVRSFLTRNVRTLDELQILIAIMESGDRWWSVPLAAREFGITQADARSALERFAARNLMDIRVTDDVRYQFRPGTEELRDAARATVDAYETDPIALARVVSASSRGMTDFADAFRIRRDDDG